MTFKLQHPSDLISKMFILEYMRELTPELLHTKASDAEKGLMFYKFIGEGDVTHVDFSWEYLLFESSMSDLEKLLSKYEKEIEVLEKKKNAKLVQNSKQLELDLQSQPVDINVYDLAQAEIKKNNDKTKLWNIQQ